VFPSSGFSSISTGPSWGVNSPIDLDKIVAILEITPTPPRSAEDEQALRRLAARDELEAPADVVGETSTSISKFESYREVRPQSISSSVCVRHPKSNVGATASVAVGLCSLLCHGGGLANRQLVV
jgi:hypothetical protein